MSEKEKAIGLFEASLKRNNKQIRDDRAEAIVRSGRLKYKRLIEDLEEELITLETDQTNMLDLSPENVTTLKVASDFNADDYARKDLEISRKIDKLNDDIKIAKNRFKVLFGELD